jgi:predicted dehydrogenase
MINIGIIGTGLIAHEHAKAIAMISDRARLFAAADIAEDRLSDFCSNYGIAHKYSEPFALINDPNVQLVAIATPPSTHEALVVSALEGGKFVFCEKPLAHSLASAARIAVVDAKYPGRLSVSYQMRYDDAFRRLIWLCKNQWLGDLESAVIERHSYIPHSNNGNGSWWGSWKVAGGGVLLTQLIHELDLLLLTMGQPMSVDARIDTRYTKIESEDYVEATIRFAGGRTARCVASVNSGRLGGRFAIQGSKGSVGLPWNLTMENSSQLSEALKKLDRALPETRPPSRSIAARGSRLVARRLGVNAKPELTPHARLYREIVRSIATGSALPIPAKDSMRSLELCMAVYESALTGKEVTLPIQRDSVVFDGLSREKYESRRGVAAPEKIATPTIGAKSLRIGLVGLDTTHATSFAKILHDPTDPFHIPGATVVAAYAGGSADMQISISRVPGFTNELRDKYGVLIFDSPERVADASDVVFILASDGRVHPSLFQAVAGRGKPVFIDKPFAISTADANEIFALAAKTNTRVFASSAFRYADNLVAALESIRTAGEKVKSCRIRYWMQIQETQGRYFWYGIHASEMLLAIMGKGVSEVEVSSAGDADTITVSHADGRQSYLIGSQSDGTFHVSIETDRRTLEIDLSPSMSSLSARILGAAVDVLTKGQGPRLWGATTAGSVAGRPGRNLDPDSEETMEVVRLLAAAQRSYASKQKTAL